MTPPRYHASAQPRLSSLAPPRSLARRILGPSLVLALAIATIGCGSESSTSTGPTPVKCQVSLEAPSNSIEPAGGKDAITVSAQPECSWTASSSATWITGLTPSSGQGSGRVEFQAAANPAATMRQGEIAVNDQKIPVQQRPAACRFEVSPVNPTIGADGGTLTIAVSTPTGCGWQASVEAGWVALTGTSGTGSGSVRLRVDPNTGATRSAALARGWRDGYADPRVVHGANLTKPKPKSEPKLCVLAGAGERGGECRRRLGNRCRQWSGRLSTDGNERGVLDHGRCWRKRDRQRCRHVQCRVEQRRCPHRHPHHRRPGVHGHPRGGGRVKLLLLSRSGQSIHGRRRWGGRRDSGFDIGRVPVDGGEPGILDHVDVAGERQRTRNRHIQRGRQQRRRANRHPRNRRAHRYDQPGWRRARAKLHVLD